jgi:hypothetical protein
MVADKMSIKTMFETKQRDLRNELSSLINHTVTKGNHREKAWIGFFKSFLPSKYDVDKGFVFDSEGAVSDQIDIIIYDALYAPLLYETKAGEKCITAESVYAVFDSKSRIEKRTLSDTDDKIASVCKLKRSSRGIINAGQQSPARKLPPIIGGILAVDSVEPDTIQEHLKKYSYIDIGCAIKKTSFVCCRDNDRSFINAQFSQKEESILAFFYIVLDSLYRLGTVAALDIRDYADATVESIKLARDDAK